MGRWGNSRLNRCRHPMSTRVTKGVDRSDHRQTHEKYVCKIHSIKMDNCMYTITMYMCDHHQVMVVVAPSLFWSMYEKSKTHLQRWIHANAPRWQWCRTQLCRIYPCSSLSLSLGALCSILHCDTHAHTKYTPTTRNTHRFFLKIRRWE